MTDRMFEDEKVEAQLSKTKLYGYAQMVMLLSSIIINITLCVYFVQKKKYKSTFHLAYLNQAGSDILIACFSTTISLPGS